MCWGSIKEASRKQRICMAHTVVCTRNIRFHGVDLAKKSSCTVQTHQAPTAATKFQMLDPDSQTQDRQKRVQTGAHRRFLPPPTLHLHFTTRTDEVPEEQTGVALLET